MTKRETLKTYLPVIFSSKRQELERMIDEELSDSEVQQALEELVKLNDSGTIHRILDLSYSDGNFTIKTQTGTTYIK